jgi:hypothetical protein
MAVNNSRLSEAGRGFSRTQKRCGKSQISKTGPGLAQPLKTGSAKSLCNIQKSTFPPQRANSKLPNSFSDIQITSPKNDGNLANKTTVHQFPFMIQNGISLSGVIAGSSSVRPAAWQKSG